MKEVLSIKDLTFSYPVYASSDPAPPGKPLFRNASLTLGEGEFVVLAGAPESGKTTLSRILCGLIPRYTGGILDGEIRLLGKQCINREPQELMEHVGVVFQNPDEQIITTRVDLEIAFPLESLGYSGDEIKERVDRELLRFGLTSFAHRNPASLSGGEKKRLLCAVLSGVSPNLWILDETLDEIDPEWKERILKFLKESRAAVLLFSSKLPRLYEEYGARYELITDAGIQRFDSQNGTVREEAIQREAERAGLIVTGSYQKTPDRISEKPTAPLLSVSDLSFSYKDEIPAGEDESGGFYLHVDSFDLYPGEVVGLAGPNGCGKTTLAKLICGLYAQSGGSVLLRSPETGEMEGTENPRARRSRAAYMFQNPDYQLFLPTIEEELSFGLKEMGWGTEQISTAVKEAIDAFNLPEGDSPPSLLSYGTRKRLQAATYWLLDRWICLFDEADSGLSPKDFSEIINLFRSPKRGIVIITHDEEISGRYANRVVRMEKGRIPGEPG